MRITVGGLLVFAVVGGAIGYGLTLTSTDWFKDKKESANREIKSLSNLFRSGEAETKKPDVPITRSEPVRGEKPIKPVARPTASKAAATPSVSKAVPTASKKTAVKKQAPKKVARKKVRSKKKKSRKVASKRKRTTSKKKISKTAKTPKKAPAVAKKKAPSVGDQGARLVGSYVEMELTTGRTVKGILEEKSATHYTLQLPGMGPFKYPVKNVKRIAAAQ